jgi:glycosyltransferase involved in cell wall biosynthesis
VFSRFPNVVTIHGNMRLIAEINQAKTFSYDWLAAQLEKVTLPKSRGVICITRYTQDAVKDLARKTWVLPNAVDASFFDVNPEPDDTGTILCVGLICYRKNQNRFIEALDSLAGTRRLRVVFLGEARKENPYAAEFLKLLETRPWCEHAGFVDRAGLKERLKKATMVALPSLEDNCPMVVLEAAAAGVPVLAAKVGGVPDLIEEGKTGLFHDPLDLAGMRAGVEKILGDREFARTLAATAKQQARERFHPLVIARRHMEIYAEVLSKPA